MTQRLVLAVDDLEDIRIIFSAILTDYGHGVMCAEDGEEAWSWQSATCPT